jgi:outer membrane lipoprotein SlyB
MVGIMESYMKIRQSLIIVGVSVSLLALSGCAQHRQHQAGGDIIIDTKHVDMGAYYQDLHECRSYAAQVNVGEKVATRAITGAVVGGAIGAIVGDSGSAKRAAGAGGVLGAVKGTGQGYGEKRRVVRNCLRGRGYHVLN